MYFWLRYGTSDNCFLCYFKVHVDMNRCSTTTVLMTVTFPCVFISSFIVCSAQILLYQMILYYSFAIILHNLSAFEKLFGPILWYYFSIPFNLPSRAKAKWKVNFFLAPAREGKQGYLNYFHHFVFMGIFWSCTCVCEPFFFHTYFCVSTLWWVRCRLFKIDTVFLPLIFDTEFDFTFSSLLFKSL